MKNNANNTNNTNSQNGLPILLVLAISAFCIGTTEFGMAGILPEIAESFHISIPAAGWLMTGYAIGVAVSAPIITAITIRFSRKNVLISLISIFIIGNIISALAPSYDILMFGRILASLCHGAFFGVGSVVAINSVTVKNRGMAVALMFSGLTFANLIGVPIGTLLGQKFGFASIFYIVAILGVIALLGIMIFVPAMQQNTKSVFKNELCAFKNIHIWLSLLVTSFGFGGVFAFFAYIAPIMTNSAGFSPQDMVWLLFIFGSGLIIGNIIGGKSADYALTKSIFVFLVLLIMILTFFCYYYSF